MDTHPIEEFYDAQHRPLTAPSRPMPRRSGHPAHAHMHGSYAHGHPGSHLPHKHVIAEAGLRRPEEIMLEAPAPAPPPRKRRAPLAKTA